MNHLAHRIPLLLGLVAGTACNFDVKVNTRDSDAGGGGAMVGDAGSGPPCTRDLDCAEGELCSPKDGYCYSKWGCLDSPSDWSEAPPIVAYRASVRSLEDPNDPSLVGALTVTACSGTDPECMAPRVLPEAVVVTSDKRLTVPFLSSDQPFTGTIGVEVSADLVTGVLQFTARNPLVGDSVAQSRIILFPKQTALQLAELAGSTDPDPSVAYFTIYDCGGNRAADVSVATQYRPDEDTPKFYPLASETEPAFASLTTTAFGAALLANTPTDRFVDFRLKDVAEERVLDVLSFVPTKSAVNYVDYYPRYSALKKWLDYAAKDAEAVP